MTLARQKTAGADGGHQHIIAYRDSPHLSLNLKAGPGWHMTVFPVVFQSGCHRRAPTLQMHSERIRRIW
jgi:hypothetical protein